MGEYLIEANGKRLHEVEKLLNEALIPTTSGLIDEDLMPYLVIFTDHTKQHWYCYGSALQGTNTIVDASSVKELILLLKLGVDYETIRDTLGVHRHE